MFLKERSITWKYYSSLAKITHVWRDWHTQVHDHWQIAFGLVSAKEHAGKMIHQCKSGRWGSVHHIEQGMHTATPFKIAYCLTSAIKSLPLATDRIDTPSDNMPTPPLALLDSNAKAEEDQAADMITTSELAT